MSKCVALKKDRGRHCPHEVVDLYAPQQVDLGGGGSSSIKRNDKEKSWALARMNWSPYKCHSYSPLLSASHNGNISWGAISNSVIIIIFL